MAPTFFKALALTLSCSLLVGANARSHLYDRAHGNLLKRAVVIPDPLPANWTSQGCYTDNTGGVKTLGGAVYKNNTGMTTEVCIGFCANRGFIFAGTEYSAECYCGNSLGAGNKATAAGDCKNGCSGNATQACGAGNRLNLYKSNQTAAAGPSVNPGPPGWSSMGCYSEATTGRTLAYGMTVAGGSTNMTVAQCCSACQASSYTLAGLEYGQECCE
ncbi:MAG: hypothetical protein M1814_002825 [Vezdaea aestivalis]|nr:MAG: hypothetical protein M1814_002825 [Vezdaea aestivalis]